MKFDQSKPYNDLPDLPPNASIETTAILRKLVSARAALAELKGVSRTIPEPDILINSILMQEAKDSSEIENIVTTHDNLFKAAVLNDDRSDPESKEVIRYRQAVWEGFGLLNKRKCINSNIAVRIYQILKNTNAEVRKVPGTTLMNTATGDVMYSPPEGESLLRDKLDNVWWFINDPVNAEIDPLIRMAVMHYQFESIHPFTDGNGRTGRILNVLFLVQEQLLNLPILYHSSFIIRKKDDYYRLLRGITIGDEWEPWILYMLESVEQTSRQTIEKISVIRTLMAETLERVKAEMPRLRHAKEIVEILFMHPYCKIEHIVERKIAVRQSASKYLKDLESMGILTSENVWKQTVYRNVALWDALSEMPR